MCSLASPATAVAQDDAETPAGTELTGEPAPPQLADEATPKVRNSTAVGTDEAYTPEDPAEGERPFLDGLHWQLLVSGFYMFNGYRVSGVYNNLVPNEAQRESYPYTNYMGFGLNFAGGDVMYTGDKFAVRLDLRWGTAADQLTPIAPVKQGFVAWMPHDRVSIDFGFFGTTFGAEYPDEWKNANYTRGALYFLRQPFNHMGVRLGADLAEIVGFMFMLTNGGVGGGTPIDSNQVPAVGWQFHLTPDGHRSVRRRGLREGYREHELSFGGNHAPTGANGNRDWQSFFDLVLSLRFGWFTLLLNADYEVTPHGIDPNTGATGQMIFQYGHSLALIFDTSDKWSIGVRGEHLSGNEYYRNFGNNVDGVSDPLRDATYGFLWTGTLTIRYKPVEYLVLSLEGRVEGAGENIYFSRSSMEDVDGIVQPDKDIYAGIILGATAHIGN
jgi:hypothetical protein